mgnify:CR=1 FL=1
MSSTLSTARIIPIASKGRLNCCKIITKVIIPADGTAAVPIRSQLLTKQFECIGIELNLFQRFVQ